MGNYDLAIANYNRAVKIDPEEAEFYFNRGLAYDKLGLIMQTKTYYEKALALNPRDAEAHFTRALACEKAGKRREATESFRGFLWSAPEGHGYGIYREYAYERIIELEKHFHDDVKGRIY